jgi:rubredoxin
MEKWKCSVCGHIYNPEKGDPGVKPGTLFEDLPSQWICPICAAPKKFFRKVA